MPSYCTGCRLYTVGSRTHPPSFLWVRAAAYLIGPVIDYTFIATVPSLYSNFLLFFIFRSLINSRVFVALSHTSHYAVTVITVARVLTYCCTSLALPVTGRRFGYIARLPVPSPLFPSSHNNVYPTTYLTFAVLPRYMVYLS